MKEPAQAAKVFKQNLLQQHASGKPLKMRMDLRDSEEERERELLSFYKQQQEWACPLHCTLVGKEYKCIREVYTTRVLNNSVR